MSESSPIRLYRFYNLERSRYGEPFALCDEHAKKQVIPSGCTLHKIADEALWACNQCAGEHARKTGDMSQLGEWKLEPDGTVRLIKKPPNRNPSEGQ